MAGFSLHVGVDTEDGKESYVNDAVALHELARAQGFDGPDDAIVDAAATHSAVTTAIADLVAQCQAKDVLLLTFATHGSSPALKREKLHLHGQSLTDAKMQSLLSAAVAGVRIVVVVDACMSMGIVTPAQRLALLQSDARLAKVLGEFQKKDLPAEGLQVVAFANAPFMKTSATFSARILELSAASKGEGALEGKPECQVGGKDHGCFTGSVLEAMAAPPDTWKDLFDAAAGQVEVHSGGSQHPVFTVYGPADTEFDSLAPFEPTT
jgi:hypothetical protein